MGVLAIFRYPVKAMLGERLAAVAVGPDGPDGDRRWVVVDEESALRTRLLATSPRRGSFEVYVMEADPGQPRTAEPHFPGTVEHLYATAGRLRAGPADGPTDLAPGDLLTFAGDVPHLYEALAPGTAALLLMDYP